MSNVTEGSSSLCQNVDTMTNRTAALHFADAERYAEAANRAADRGSHEHAHTMQRAYAIMDGRGFVRLADHGTGHWEPTNNDL